MTGAQLRFLADKLHIQAMGPLRHGRFYFGRAVACDDHRRTCMQLGSRLKHMPQQGLARQFLQNLGQAAFHASALTRRHDNHVQGRLR